MTLKNSGPVFIIIAALLWSVDGLLRTTLYTLSPAVVVFWEHALGTAVLLPFIFVRLNEFKSLSKKEWIAIAVVSLFSGALGTIFYTAALGKVQYVQFSVVVLLQQLQPIWAILTAALLLKEPLQKKFVWWAAAAIAASYLVTFKDLTVNVHTGSGTVEAAALAVAAGMMWGASTSFSKIVLFKASFVTTTFLRFVLAALFALVIAFIIQPSLHIVSLSTSQWITLLAITFSTGLVALLIYYYGLKRTPARVSAICELVWPASAVVIDYLYFHRSLSITQIIGVAIVLVAIYQISKFKT